jgi:phytoene dehydrogenase-like protein
VRQCDAIVIGAGHNGLVASAILAGAGLRTLVLERAVEIGGCVVTSEIAPGYRCPLLTHRAGLDPLVVRSLRLASSGLEIIRPEARATAPTVDGRALTLWSDVALASADVARFSAKDADRYPAFLSSVTAVTRVLRTVLSAAPPDIDQPGAADVVAAFTTVRQFRALGRKDAYRLLRWLTMPVADFASEWFDSEPLRATIAAGGLLGSFLGPRSAGSAAVLLLLASQDGHPIAPGWTARGGIGAVSTALAGAARQAGATIRTGADVRRILVDDGRATGVALATGEEIPARLVLSSLDPRHTLLSLVDPGRLPPGFLRHVEQIRMRGTLAKVNYAVATLPAFPGLQSLAPDRRQAALTGCIRLARHTDAIERAFDCAKYGRFADEPWIELAIPSIADPALAPRGHHVVSAYVQFAPFDLRGTDWDVERQRLGDVTTNTIDRYSPGFKRSIVGQQVITPLDLERRWGLTGGHVFHGELSLDQLVVARPLLGWARYRTPLRHLYLCGSGTHPGIGVDGRPGLLAARTAISETWR